VDPPSDRLRAPWRGPLADEQRDAEAEAVAAICRRLVGTIEVSRADGPPTKLKPGDIALLAPAGTDLWRYEAALKAKGLSISSQAGKTLMLREETQDVLALLRALADPTDTLAFGAFMRAGRSWA
jgi:ATP-dependent exoDNAse (exonuclease V) beta subunit